MLERTQQCQIVRYIPGRARYAVPGLRGNKALAAFLQREIGLHKPEWTVLADFRSGRVLVIAIDPVSVTREWEVEVVLQLKAALVRFQSDRRMPNRDHAAHPAEDGLSSREAAKRLALFGANLMPEVRGPGWKAILVQQLKDGMSLMLLTVGFGSLVLRRYTDALSILAVLGVSGGVAIWQESRIQKEAGGMQSLEAQVAHVLRDGIRQVLPARELVPDDVVIVEAGDAVPADALILQSTHLQVDESSITGEAMPVAKKSGPLYLGTAVTRGKAKILVTQTGADTYLGQIANGLSLQYMEVTPLQKNLQHMFRKFAIGVGVWTGLTAIIALLRGNPFINVLMVNLTLYVSAVPEGLPLLLLVAQVYTARKLHKKSLHVRRLQSLEALAATTVLCADKTGTLTQNQMTVAVSFPQLLPETALRMPGLLESAALCNDASLTASEERGDPLELALLRYVKNQAVDIPALSAQFVRKRDEPFESEQRRMSVICKGPDGRHWLIVKGAPEVILSSCGRSEADRGTILAGIEQMAANNAYKMISFAMRELSDTEIESPFGELFVRMTFLGSMGFIDPPRPGALDSLRQLRESGIRVTMLTGDHPATALAVGNSLGMQVGSLDDVLVGDEVDRLTDRELADALTSTGVFARLKPLQKLKVVKALKEKGEVVAMTGDGVNDALAIRHAHVGIAMGGEGCEVAKRSSSLWLVDDDLGNFVKGVHEGRRMLGNIERAVGYLLSGNLSEVLFLSAGIWLGWPVAFNPTQILLINLLTDSLPTFVILTKSQNGQSMQRHRRLFGKPFWKKVAVRTMLMGGVSLGLYQIGLKQFRNTEAARSMALFSVVINQLLQLQGWTESPGQMPIIPRGRSLTGTVAVTLAALFGSLYVPGLQRLFGTTALPAPGLLMGTLGAVGATATAQAILRKDDSDGEQRTPSQAVGGSKIITLPGAGHQY